MLASRGEAPAVAAATGLSPVTVCDDSDSRAIKERTRVEQDGRSIPGFDINAPAAARGRSCII